MDSIPEVFYRPEDLYISRQWGIRTEEWMGYCRTVSETVVLAELGERMKDEGGRMKDEGGRMKDEGEEHYAESSSFIPPQSGSKLHPSSFPPHPFLAMVDGSLIHWFLESLPGEARDRLLPPILAAWEKLRVAKLPVVGYLSASRSGETLNFLRLQTCPYDQPDCSTHCPGVTEQAPCQVFAPLRDTALWVTQLQPGQRGPLWRSSAKILELYGEHIVHFCYVNVGTEIARVEFPAWVTEDLEMLNTTLSLTLTQVQKGYGYPVSLAEAHNQAVVRGSDRDRFFSLLEQEMIRAGLKNIGTSYKEARKRGSIA
jgi:NurA domain